MDDFCPQLLSEYPLHQLDEIIFDDAWVLEPKLDGSFISVRSPAVNAVGHSSPGVGAAGIEAANVQTPYFVGRNGQRRLLDRNKPSSSAFDADKATTAFLVAIQALVHTDTAIDGEWIKGCFFPFDLPYAAGVVDHRSAFGLRRQALEELVRLWAPPLSAVRLVPQARGSDRKRRLLGTALATRSEGVVAKHSEGLYSPGRRSVHCRKYKFVNEADLFVTATHTKGHSNAVLAAYSLEGQVVEVGSVSVAGRHRPVVGDVVTVRYLYASDSQRLVQPRLIRIRSDKAVQECSIAQLVGTQKDPSELLRHLEGI